MPLHKHVSRRLPLAESLEPALVASSFKREHNHTNILFHFAAVPFLCIGELRL
jgi:hypothetical protein